MDLRRPTPTGPGGGDQTLAVLDERAFGTPDGVPVVLEDNQVRTVDASALPAVSGDSRRCSALATSDGPTSPTRLPPTCSAAGPATVTSERGEGQALSRSAPRLSRAKATAISDITATTMMKIPTGT